MDRRALLTGLLTSPAIAVAVPAQASQRAPLTLWYVPKRLYLRLTGDRYGASKQRGQIKIAQHGFYRCGLRFDRMLVTPPDYHDDWHRLNDTDRFWEYINNDTDRFWEYINNERCGLLPGGKYEIVKS